MLLIASATAVGDIAGVLVSTHEVTITTIVLTCLMSLGETAFTLYDFTSNIVVLLAEVNKISNAALGEVGEINGIMCATLHPDYTEVKVNFVEPNAARAVLGVGLYLILCIVLAVMMYFILQKSRFR